MAMDANSLAIRMAGEHAAGLEPKTFLCSGRAEAQGRRSDACFDLFGSRHRHAELNRNSCLTGMRRKPSAAFFVFATFCYLPSRSTFPFASSFIFLTVGSELIWPVVSVRVAGGLLFGTDV